MRSTAEHITELLLELRPQEKMLLIVVTQSLRLARRMQQIRQVDQGMFKDLLEK